MIAHLRGTVAHREAASVIVDVHGVGYLVHVPGSADIPARGQEVELRTAMVVREDSMTLYGFTDAAAQQLFELLLGTSGVGPKLALAILSTHRPTVIRQALATSDIDLLVAVPGIGKKSAQKLILELKDKVGALDAPDVLRSPGTTHDADGVPSSVTDTRDALLQLGYGPAEVAATLSELDLDGDTSTLLRRALRAIGSGG
jgi:Holliday junction DNA helicase RuvA